MLLLPEYQHTAAQPNMPNMPTRRGASFSIPGNMPAWQHASMAACQYMAAWQHALFSMAAIGMVAIPEY